MKRRLEYSGFLDRIEGEFGIVVVHEREIQIPIKLLPSKIKEGTYLTITIEPDLKRTKKENQEISNLIDELAAGDNGKDIEI